MPPTGENGTRQKHRGASFAFDYSTRHGKMQRLSRKKPQRRADFGKKKQKTADFFIFSKKEFTSLRFYAIIYNVLVYPFVTRALRAENVRRHSHEMPCLRKSRQPRFGQPPH